MECVTTYERLDPDTVRGEGIKFTQIYTSFDVREIEELEEHLKKAMGSVVVFECKEGERGVVQVLNVLKTILG